MANLLRDLSYAFRALTRTPAFSALSLVTIALGIAASTAIFSMVNGALLKPLPYAADDRLVRLLQPTATNPSAGGLSVVEVGDYRQLTSTFEGVAEYHSMPFQFYGKGDPQRVQTGVVSDNFFKLLGVRPIIGRDFAPGEDEVGQPNVILLSHGYWLEAFGGDSSVIGSTFTMNDRVGTIVGVLPPLPVYPNANDIWMPAGQCPFRSAPDMLHDRSMRMVQAFAVLRPGVTREAAQQQLELTANNLHAAYPAAYPAERSFGIGTVPVREELTRTARPLLYTLLASSVFVLLIAAANFANLTLSRQLHRRAELALRSALGAGQAQLFRQLATESLLVTTAGTVAGVGLAYAGIGLLRTFASRFSPRAGEIAIDPMVLAFAVGTSVVVGLIAATLPIWKRSLHLSQDLRSGAAATTSNRRDVFVRNGLVAAQVAVAFVVLAGAGLMVRSLVRLETTHGGYQTANVLTARVDLNWSRYVNPELQRDFAERLMQRLRELPGVTSVAVSSDFPLANPIPGTTPFTIRGQETDARGRPVSDVTVASADYFGVIGIPLVRGRLFTAADRDSINMSAVISDRLARTYWRGDDPIGAQVSVNGGRTWLTVVGVVGDVRQNGPAETIADQIYIPHHVQPVNDFRVLLRTASEPMAFADDVREAAWSIDPQQPVVQVQSLDDLRGTRLTEPRVATLLLTIFAVISLVITAGGLFGIVANAVNQRTSEIGVRLALGARPGHVLWSVTRSGAVLVGLGLLAGLATAVAATRLMTSLLFELSATDPVTFFGVALLLAGISAAACLVPARLALRVEPITALRAR